MFNNFRKDIIAYGLPGAVLKGTLTPEAQAVCMPVIEKNQNMKRAKKQIKKRERRIKNDNISEIAFYLERQDGIKREIIEVDGEQVIAKVASRENLFDSNFNKYTIRVQPHELVRKDFHKLVVYLKIGNSYARVFNAKKINENQILVDLNENKSSISDYVILR